MVNPLNRGSLLLPRIACDAIGARTQSILPKSVLFTITFAILALSPLCSAQGQEPNIRKVSSIDSAIEVARADMRAERSAMIGANMEFSDKEGAAFWPIYRKYESERSAVDDLRVVVIKEYAEKYLSMTDADAKAMTEKMFEYDSREIELKRKYFTELNKVLPALTVAKFFQLEHRIDLVMGIKVESSLPPLTESQEVQ